MTDYVYDIETFPNVFIVCIKQVNTPFKWQYQISPWKDDSKAIIDFFRQCAHNHNRMVGFNNLGFDYPVIHTLLRMGGSDAATLYSKAMSIITSQDDDRWSHLIYQSDRACTQIDLYQIHHFSNPAKATSLKTLEFNMRSESVEDLPFPVGKELTREECEILINYCSHDVSETEKFYHHTKDAIKFREGLVAQFPDKDWLNFDDTKIGKEYFSMKLKAAGVNLYEYGTNGRSPRQSPRQSIVLRDVIFPWITFEEGSDFERLLNWLKGQTIIKTKNVFKNVEAVVNGFTYVFGLGGIHGAIENETVLSHDTQIIESWDVASMYPNMAIVNDLYPEHLGSQFNVIYKSLYEERKKYPKKSANSEMIKLALNSTYGNSNNKFSFFYDPKFTMSITVNGQLLICKLAEMVMTIPTVRIIMVNTDGIEYTVHPDYKDQAAAQCNEWQVLTKLQLENASYSKMWIRDVNNYIALYSNGGVKRKSCFEYELDWHQDHSCLVVPRIAERVLVSGEPIRKLVEEWDQPLDFLLRTKVNRGSHLVIEIDGAVEKLQNNTRYVVSKSGGFLYKWMPPLEGRSEWRKLAVRSGWRSKVCNQLKDFNRCDVDHEYYIREVEKLVLPLGEFK